jgi:maltooligosyltrehalose trehalohydrolase
LNLLASAQQAGATVLPGGRWRFRVWAPDAQRVDLHLKSPDDQLLRMHEDSGGFHTLDVPDLPSGSTYLYRLDSNEEWPDPASRSQPYGVHGPSQAIDPRSFPWSCTEWNPISLPSAVIYELHVGTYTPEGTFDGVIPHLDELVELGVTTIEIMPVAQFPGPRNWGYDGTYLFAPQNSYGGPQGLQRLVDAAHARGLTVILDVVYNHLGPEGNYLGKFGRYYTNRYCTPWGSALNFDGADSGPVRDFFIANALYWLDEYCIDGLRLDAIDRIYDCGAHHFLAELKESVRQLEKRIGRKLVLIAESDLNDRRVLDAGDRGGYGLDAQWTDDFHHSLHTLLTGETAGYYADFGKLEHLATTLRQGWFYEGQYSSFRRRKHGNSPQGISHEHFVVCSQNHDQVGNRARSDRLSSLLDLAGMKLAAGVTLLSPFVPMLFMGEEYGETAPFWYFTSHQDAALIEAVRSGRQKEFAHFAWQHEIPDPQNEETFRGATLQHARKKQQPHSSLRDFYRQLIALRNKYSLGHPGPSEITTHETENVILVLRKSPPAALLMIFHFGAAATRFTHALPPGDWRVILNSDLDSGRDVSAAPVAQNVSVAIGVSAAHGAGDTRHRGLSPSFAATAEGSLSLNMPARSFVVLENTSPLEE